MSLNSMPISFSSSNESETFYNACAEGNLRVVKLYLAEQGFDMNAGENCGWTGFHFACARGKLNVVQFLIQQGFDVNVGSNYGKTGFHQACGYGHLNVVQFLIQKGFDMYVVSYMGWTGFHCACVTGKLNVVKFLIQKGFDVNVGDNLGSTGLKMMIRRYNSLISLGVENFSSCALFLIEAGATLNENDVFEELISAIQNRIIEITFTKQILFKKWTGRVAQVITDFSMEPYTSTSLQNLTQILDY